jgi:murein L,D-transpeptidase YafK
MACNNKYNTSERGDRVLLAEQTKGAVVEELWCHCGVPSGNPLLLLAYKEEQTLEIWTEDTPTWVLLQSYDICAASGMLGRKRKEGDRQVPEGLYHINRFNPKSNFFLSLGINYPNDADRAVADPTRPGGDIFIHGGCQSVGCLAMTDESIMEIYLLCLAAANNGQENIPVYIFPYRMDRTNQPDPTLRQNNQEAWENLQMAHDIWNRTRRPLRFEYTPSGLYDVLADTH